MGVKMLYIINHITLATAAVSMLGTLYIYSIVSRGIKSFFYRFMQLTFYSLFYQKTSWRSDFPWLCFVDQTLILHSISYLEHHVHTCQKRDYDEQKAVVVKYHY